MRDAHVCLWLVTVETFLNFFGFGFHTICFRFYHGAWLVKVLLPVFGHLPPPTGYDTRDGPNGLGE